MEPIKVLLLDSEEVFREGLARLLKEQPHIEIVHQCASGQEAIEKCKDMKPDVVLIDSQLQEGDPLKVVREMGKSSPETKAVVISRLRSQPEPLEILQSGARGCLAKSISAVDLVKSIELISTGRIVISPLFTEGFLAEVASLRKGEDTAGTEAKAVLSAREIDIARLIAQGATNKEIADRLRIAENTVKVHVKNILNKLDLRNRQHLAAYAVLQNWVAANGQT